MASNDPADEGAAVMAQARAADADGVAEVLEAAKRVVQGVEAIREPVVLRYRQPEELRRSRNLLVLCKTDTMMAAVQVLKNGGERKMHSHPNMDGLWFVLSGRAAFYGAGNELIAELGPNESVLIPRDAPYWFESIGDEICEILQVEAFTNPGHDIGYQDHDPDAAPPFEDLSIDFLDN
jgi:mannose-6-phosphate isomerase-like protein (cupin superfamily)